MRHSGRERLILDEQKEQGHPEGGTAALVLSTAALPLWEYLPRCHKARRVLQWRQHTCIYVALAVLMTGREIEGPLEEREICGSEGRAGAGKERTRGED